MILPPLTLFQCEKKMVDRVYKADLPRLRNSLEKLRDEFSNLDTKTDWTKLRIEPLLKHTESLEQLLYSPEFSKEFSRLRKGVGMFHSDLVYLRENIKILENMLQSEKKLAK
jgi:predicted  nucleic acid-binding Zn-ribbon protein